MSRNAGAHDSAGESFAGVLEHLTRHPRPETPAARSLLPATERKPGQDVEEGDGVPLSYEQALHLHARRRTNPDADLDLSTIALSKSSATQRETPLAARASVKSPDSQLSSEPAKSAKGSAALKTAAQSSTQTNSQPKKSPAIRRASAALKVAASGTSASISSAKAPSKAAASTRKLKPTSKPAKSRRNSHQVPVHAAPLASLAKSVAKVEHQEVQLDLVHQRRTIVSVRLTEAELLRLKDRASESGISVSAYMRSCILDADQLRAQVKQTLAEIRAFGLRPEPSLPTVLSLPGKQRAGGRWFQGFQLLLRSATFVMGSWFRFGRSA